MDKHIRLKEYIRSHPDDVSNVVDFGPAADRFYPFDFTASNTDLSPEDIEDTDKFSAWVSLKLADNHCRYGIGGYMEHRTIYARSEHFNAPGEPRRLHLGVDIWSAAGTPVYAPLAGTVHSFRNNNNFGDYGPTIILQHELDGLQLFSLYGHLSRSDLNELYNGFPVSAGQKIGCFGRPDENGHWPPHLHFQLMFDMEGCYGDYPGVAKYSEKNKYLQNIPDPALILRFPQFNITNRDI